MTELDVSRIRAHFDFPSTGRVVTNNAAGTQPPRELVELYHELAPWYENVRRGQSTAARRTTELFEDAYDTIADWINAPGRRCAPARPAPSCRLSFAVYNNEEDVDRAVAAVADR
jgi:cysteine desulfurase/selenocysteine lyase